MSKVPEVTIFFWIIKIMATTVGETAADYLNFHLHIGLTNTTLIMSALLVISLIVQFKAKKYIPAVYWIAVVLISVVGTLVTDNLTDHFGVPLIASTIVFTFLLAITFATWYVNERTLSIHSIFTIKRESYYWLAILFTFALGTAAGDLISEDLGFGYLISGIIFAVLIALVTIGYYVFKMNAVLAFWIAYILTRPLGASIGDFMSQSPKHGGLGLGTTGTSVIFLVIILALVVYLSITKRDTSKMISE
ncbi:COG4705 family protein [Falsibacillus pallidus]|uniref:COG4705 family protein n=1 Tax=Falsibacillus pallidus TaxID=493781 RepID=UPI003D97E601